MKTPLKAITTTHRATGIKERYNKIIDVKTRLHANERYIALCVDIENIQARKLFASHPHKNKFEFFTYHLN